MNPYEVSEKILENSSRDCPNCRSTHLIRTDNRHLPFPPAAKIAYGWLVNAWRYAFLTPIDTCQDCAARFHIRSAASLLLMIIWILGPIILMQIIFG